MAGDADTVDFAVTVDFAGATVCVFAADCAAKVCGALGEVFCADCV